jgi:hypothetical protein
MIKTKQELLNHFSDINEMYNNPFMYQTLSNMIDELLEQQPCEDCKVKKEAYIQGYDYGVKDWFKSKSQPCEDAISREDTKNLFWDGTEGYDCRGFTRMEIGEMLDDLPSVTPKTRWIPVSEQHPKENEYIGNVCKYYLIQDEYGDMHVAHLSNVGWIPMNSLKAIGDEVIAWQELPQPYKAESEGEG